MFRMLNIVERYGTRNNEALRPHLLTYLFLTDFGSVSRFGVLSRSLCAFFLLVPQSETWARSKPPHKGHRGNMDLSAKPKRPPFLNRKTDVSVAILIGICHTSSHLYHLSRTCSEKRMKMPSVCLQINRPLSVLPRSST